MLTVGCTGKEICPEDTRFFCFGSLRSLKTLLRCSGLVLYLQIHQYFRASSSQIVWDMYTGITSRKGGCSHSRAQAAEMSVLVKRSYNTHFLCVCTE